MDVTNNVMGVSPVNVNPSQSFLSSSMATSSPLDESYPGNHLVFVDAALADIDTLVQSIDNAQVVLLGAGEDGVATITETLQGAAQKIDGVHIFTHGSQGLVQLGNVVLDGASLSQYQNDLQSWAQSLHPDADLLFYGCNIAAGADGLAFVQQISQLTQADVAASSNLTGHADLGGDWQLEVKTGEISVAFASEEFQGILPTYNDHTYQLTNGTTSWSVAQAEAQSLGGTLVAINDAAEQAWLNQTFGNSERLWIGLTDTAQEGNFQWVTGEVNSYQNWAPGEPNDYKFNGSFPAGEDYSLMNWNTAGQWNDMPDSFGGTFRGIIEIESDDPPPSSGDGLRADYYDNINFTDLKLSRTDATVDFAWGEGSPAANIGVDSFSVRWTGQIEAEFSETYTFSTTTDDGVRLWVNDQLIIDKFVDQGPTAHTGAITLQAGQKYNIRMDYYENGGGAVAGLSWTSASQPLEIVPQSQLYSTNGPDPEPPLPTGNGDGLTADYYDNINFTNLKLTRTDASVNFDWGQAAPDPSIGADTFSVRWSGQVEPRFSETYTFTTTTDDGVRLWVNDQLIVDKFIDQGPTGHTGTITLQAGQKYDIRMDYYENGGGAVAELMWSSASQPLEIIPQSQLYSGDNSGSSTFALQDSDTIFVNEAAGVATVTAVRTGSTQDRITLEYTTNEVGGAGAAQAGADYTTPTFNGRPNTGQIVFEVGESEKAFTIPIINDTLFEGNETFAVGLQNPSAGTLGAPRTVLLTIVDNDTATALSISEANLSVSEGASTASVTVQRSGNVTGAASVNFNTQNGSAVSGADYTAISGTLNFAAGQTTQTINIPILNDAFVEGNETFAVALSNPTGAVLGSQTSSTITIIDNDLALGNLNRSTAITGLVQPTTLDWTPDGRYMLVAEKSGVVKVVDNGVLRSTPLVNLSSQVNATRDRGLLGLAIHPEFDTNPYVYLLHTYDPPETSGRTGLAGPDGNGNRPSRLVRLTVNPTTMVADPNSLLVLVGTNSTWAYTSQPGSNSTGNISIPPSGIVNGTTITAPSSQIDTGTQDNDPTRPGIQNQNIRDYLATDSESHSIGDLEFGTDGLLYLSNGDGTSYNFTDPRTVRTQDINNLSGKVLRIDPLTGKGVASNPFFEGDGSSNQSKVFYYGVRNPFRVAIDPVSERPIFGDVGWNRWEEINTGQPGTNFGWPYLEGPNQTGGYSGLSQAISFYNNGNRNNPGDAAAVFPILSRSHGAPDNANAIMVGDFYNSETLMFGDVNGGTLYAATLNNNRQVTNVQVFDSNISFVVDMKMSPDGRLYGVNLVSGQILRWDPA